jgi:hypothetical protein
MFKNKFIFCLKFLLLISFVFFNTSSAEYFLFKKVDGKKTVLNIEEYCKALDVVMKWQFPMSLNNLEEIQNLPADELTDLCEYEIGFIKQKLFEAGFKNVRIKYIPTTLYEIIILGSGLKEVVDGCESLAIDPSDEELFSACESLDCYKNALERLDYSKFIPNNLKNKYLMDLKFKVNNKIIDLLNDNKFSIQKYFSKFIDSCNDDIRLEHRHVDDVDYLEFNKKKVTLKLEKILQDEENAYFAGKFLIYRGSSSFADKLSDSYGYFRVHGLSYGNTLFAGFLKDYDACAFAYMFDVNFYQNSSFFEDPLDLNIVGYVTSIDKLKYFEKDRKLRDIFFIPPVDTLVGLLAFDEGFHSRAFNVSSEDRLNRSSYYSKYLEDNATVKTFIYSDNDKKYLKLKLVDKRYSFQKNGAFFMKKNPIVVNIDEI